MPAVVYVGDAKPLVCPFTNKTIGTDIVAKFGEALRVSAPTWLDQVAPDDEVAYSVGGENKILIRMEVFCLGG